MRRLLARAETLVSRKVFDVTSDHGTVMHPIFGVTEVTAVNQVKYGAGELIFSEGDSADCAYLVEEGQIEILARQGARIKSLSLIGPGEIFGEMGVIDGSPRSASAVAAEDCRLLRISLEQFHELLGRGESFHAELLKKVVSRFRETQKAYLRGSQGRRTESSELGPGYAMLARNRDLSDAIDRGEIEPFLQPIIDMERGQWRGFEALARWRSPQQGMIAPAEFLPLAERTGLIRRIDLAIAERAMTLCRHFPGNFSPYVNINFSAWHFRDDGLCSTLGSLLARTGMDPAQVRIELTESLMLHDPDRALKVMNDLAALGVKLALDDFGTGYSSLSVLNRMPIHVLKIDRTLIGGLPERGRPRVVLRNVLALARDLGMEIVIEGVEDTATVDALLELGCTIGQGFLFARPMPAREAAAAWESHQAAGPFMAS